MIDRAVRLKLLNLDGLPALPAVITQIMSAIEDDRSSATDLTAILEVDQGISARVLRMANSAFYGLRHKVASIRQAVVVIGFDAVRLLALATSVFDVFAQRQQDLLNAEAFWMHSLGAAKAAQLLSARCNPAERPEACFTAGLLHDMGKCAMSLILGATYGRVLAKARDTNRPLVDVETEDLGTTHSEVGAWLAGKWRFPEMIVDAIQHVENVEQYTGEYRTEVAIVALANALARNAEFGADGDTAPRPVERWVTYTLGLKEGAVAELTEELGQFRDETRELFDVLAEG